VHGDGGHLWFGVIFHSHKYGILRSQNQVVKFFITGEKSTRYFFGRNRNSQFVNRVTREMKGYIPRRALTLTIKGKRPMR
jgi:hypothetical protein